MGNEMKVKWYLKVMKGYVKWYLKGEVFADIYFIDIIFLDVRAGIGISDGFDLTYADGEELLVDP